MVELFIKVIVIVIAQHSKRWFCENFVSRVFNLLSIVLYFLPF